MWFIIDLTHTFDIISLFYCYFNVRGTPLNSHYSPYGDFHPLVSNNDNFLLLITLLCAGRTFENPKDRNTWLLRFLLLFSVEIWDK